MTKGPAPAKSGLLLAALKGPAINQIQARISCLGLLSIYRARCETYFAPYYATLQNVAVLVCRDLT